MRQSWRHTLLPDSEVQMRPGLHRPVSHLPPSSMVPRSEQTQSMRSPANSQQAVPAGQTAGAPERGSHGTRQALNASCTWLPQEMGLQALPGPQSASVAQYFLQTPTCPPAPQEENRQGSPAPQS